MEWPNLPLSESGISCFCRIVAPGKTILAEAMLHTSGATTRLGRVEDGTAASDFEPEEHKRSTSVNTAVLNAQWRDHKINVLDTPGYADYRGEVISGIRVADTAVIVIAAQAGIEVGTGQMWNMAEERDLPRIVFISKIDRENSRLLLGRGIPSRAFRSPTWVPVQIPVGAEADFSGVGEPA